MIPVSLVALTGLLLAGSLPVAAQSGPFISEILANNSAGLTDAAGNHPDWIEIRNPGTAAINLAGWHLTDDAQDLIRFTFPAGFTIPAGGHRIVFAGVNPTPGPGETFTGFSLDAAGEYLALVKPDGVAIASEFVPAFAAQRTDISWGRTENLNDSQHYYFTTPTPGTANGAGVLGFVGDTQFTPKRGFADAPFNLTITATEPGSTIRYTLDGSPPGPGNGLIYTAPIPITTTTVVRAMAEKSGYLSTGIDTQTYIFIASVLQQPVNVPGWPNPTYSLGSGNAVHDYQMDPTVVNAPAYSGMIAQAMRAIPTMSIAASRSEMFGATGFYDGAETGGVGIEKPASVEILYPDTPLANEHAYGGIEGHSHVRMKRSLRLTFRSELGDSTFKTDLFKRMPWNPPGVDSQDRLILRAGNNRAWSRSWSKEKTTYCEDEFARQTQLAVSGYGMRGAFVHLYINGLYWGLYNVCERADTHYGSRYFGGENEDWFAVNHGGVLSGSTTRYDYLKSTLKNKDMTVAANYAELAGYLDIESFLDYLFVQWYPATGDWPSNNWYAGHRNATSALGPTPLRYFAWDGEWSWDLPHSSAPNPAPYNPWVHAEFRSARTKTQGTAMAQIFNSAKDNPGFRRTLADRAYRHLFNDGPMSDAAMLARFTQITNYVRDAIVGESARWGDTLEGSGQPTFTRDVHWQNEVTVLSNLITGRAVRFRDALRAEGYYPAIDPPVFGQRGGTVASGYALTLTNPNASGSIRYTVDDTDPSDAGALTYSGPIIIPNSQRVRARVLSAGTWSALDEAIFIVPVPPALRITELMYHPSPPTPVEIAAGFTDQDDFEFIELHNRGTADIPLTGIHFTEGVTFTFPAATLAPGARVVVVSNPAAFALRYGNSITVLGSYAPSRLANGGERLRLATALDETIADLTYGDTDLWPAEADGLGRSLVFVDTAAGTDPSLSANWRASVLPGGSPGNADTTGFNAWIAASLPGRPAADLAPTADPDSDSIVNLMEFALGLDPLTPDTHRLPDGQFVTGTFSVDYARDLFRTGITLTAERSDALAPGGWSTTGLTDSLLSTARGQELRRASVPANSSSRIFLRLKVLLE